MTDNEGTQPRPSVSQDELDRLARATLIGTDGDKIGSVDQVYIDDKTGRPSWVSVKMGLFGSRATLVPVDDVKGDGDDLQVPYTKDIVKNAPRVDADEHVSRGEENELHEYYRSHGWQGGDAAGDRSDTGTADSAATGDAAGTSDASATDSTDAPRGRHAAGVGGAAAGAGAAGVAGAAFAGGRHDDSSDSSTESSGGDRSSADSGFPGSAERSDRPVEPTTTYGSGSAGDQSASDGEQPVDPTTPTPPSTPQVPDAPGTPGAPGAPEVPATPGSPGAPSSPGAPEAPSPPDAPSPGINPDPSGRADVPGTPPTAEDPDRMAFDGSSSERSGDPTRPATSYNSDAGYRTGEQEGGDLPASSDEVADDDLDADSGIGTSSDLRDRQDTSDSGDRAGLMSTGGEIDQQPSGSDWEGDEANSYAFAGGSSGGSDSGSGGGGRRISSYDEVVDGGYSIGSAAPIHDNAQPLGHPVRAWHDSMSFRDDAETEGEREPDVWFLDATAARNAGFHPAD